MRPARRPTINRYAAVESFLIAPQRSHLHACNDNAQPDRAALIVVAIGQVSAAIASISGILAAALLLIR
jgi:hypothetical protein